MTEHMRQGNNNIHIKEGFSGDHMCTQQVMIVGKQL